MKTIKISLGLILISSFMSILNAQSKDNLAILTSHKWVYKGYDDMDIYHWFNETTIYCAEIWDDDEPDNKEEDIIKNPFYLHNTNMVDHFDDSKVGKVKTGSYIIFKTALGRICAYVITELSHEVLKMIPIPTREGDAIMGAMVYEFKAIPIDTPIPPKKIN